MRSGRSPIRRRWEAMADTVGSRHGAQVRRDLDKGREAAHGGEQGREGIVSQRDRHKAAVPHHKADSSWSLSE